MVASSFSDHLSESVTRLLAEIELGSGLTMGEAGRALGGTDPSSVFRHIKIGSKAESGERVKLEGIRIGGRWWTTRPAIQRFTLALTMPVERPVQAATLKPRRSKANEKLKAMGC